MENDQFCKGCKCRESCLEKDSLEARMNCSAWLFYEDEEGDKTNER